MEEKNIKKKDIVIDGQQDTLLFQDVCSIIEHGRQQAYGSVNQIAIATYWNVGKRIVEEEQNGEKRAAYGIGLMKSLSESLIPVYGRSYSKRNLDYYKKFYLLFPDPEKVNTCVHNLEWSHIRRVLSVTSPEARLWYLENAEWKEQPNLAVPSKQPTSTPTSTRQVPDKYPDKYPDKFYSHQ